MRLLFCFLCVVSLGWSQTVQITLLTCYEDITCDKEKREWAEFVQEEKGNSPVFTAFLAKAKCRVKGPFDFALLPQREDLWENKSSLLGANLLFLEEKEDPERLKPVYREIEGLHVAFFGLSQERASEDGSVYYMSSLETARRLVRECKGKGTDLVVVYCDLSLQEVKEIAREVHGIDVILGKASFGPLAWFEEKTFIYLGGSTLARLDLLVDKKHTWRGKSLSYYPLWREVPQ